LFRANGKGGSEEAKGPGSTGVRGKAPEAGRADWELLSQVGQGAVCCQGDEGTTRGLEGTHVWFLLHTEKGKKRREMESMVTEKNGGNRAQSFFRGTREGVWSTAPHEKKQSSNDRFKEKEKKGTVITINKVYRHKRSKGGERKPVHR